MLHFACVSPVVCTILTTYQALQILDVSTTVAFALGLEIYILKMYIKYTAPGSKVSPKHGGHTTNIYYIPPNARAEEVRYPTEIYHIKYLNKTDVRTGGIKRKSILSQSLSIYPVN